MDRKQILNKQLEILDAFIQVADGLKWWIDGGAWLDHKIQELNDGGKFFVFQNIEIGMPRKDYDIYLERTSRLPVNYHNKSHESDDVPYAYSRLMDSSTTALVLSEAEFWMKGKPQGIYISVYPFDNVCSDEALGEWVKGLEKARKELSSVYIFRNYGIRSDEEYSCLYEKYIQSIRKYNDQETDEFANLSKISGGECHIRNKEHYRSLRKTEYHGRVVFVPNEEPCEAEIVAWLSNEEKVNKVDTDMPYGHYLFNRRILTDEEFLGSLNLCIDKSFLQDEVRDGHLVKKEMKKVWAVELDLLNEFGRVCSDLGLEWWVDGGTMLGAVRHKGFIPWDDDVDVAMLRKDFDELLEHCDAFSGKYFLQSYETDDLMMTKYRLLNLNTTYMGYHNYVNPYARFQMTGFIDIFPFENIKDIEDWRERSRTKNEYRSQASRHLLNYYKEGKDSERLLADEYFRKHKDITKGDCSYDDAKWLADVTLTSVDNRFKRYKEDYEDTILVDFEMLRLPCPKNWGRCIELQYGKNWQTPIKGTQYHSCWVYDNDNSYNSYVDYLVGLFSEPKN